MKKNFLLLIISLVCIGSQGQVSQLSDPLINGGRIKKFSMNANCVIIANEGGLFKTTNQGQNWTEINSSFNPYSLYCNSLVSIGTDFYVLSNSIFGSGIYKSSNDGISWVPKNLDNWSAWSLGKLSNLLYALGHNWMTNEMQLYSSTDGNNWTPKAIVWSGNWPGGNCELLSFNQNKLYLRIQSNLYYTSDGNNIVPIAVNGLSVSDFSDGDIYGDALGNIYYRGDNSSIYKYNFSTQTWSDITTGKIPNDYQVLNFSVTDNAIFFTAMPSAAPIKLYKSIDQGVTFNELASTGLSVAMVENIIEFGTNTFIGNDLYDQVLLSTDGGESWSIITNQYIASFAGNIRNAGDSLFYIRGNKGVIASADLGLNWFQVNNGIPDFGGGIAYFASQLTAVRDTLFSFVQPDPFSNNLSLYKSTNLGSSWSSYPISAPYNAGSKYTFAGKCDSLLFVNYKNGDNSYSLIYTPDYGTTWYKPNSQNSGNPFFVKGSKDHLFAFNGTEDRDFSNIFRANSFGMSFSTLSTTINQNIVIKRVINENGNRAEPVMDCDVSNNKAIFVVRDNTNNTTYKLFSYNTNSQLWSEINTQGLPSNYIANYVKCIDNNVWLLATNFGLYKSTNGGQSWLITHNPEQWKKGIEVNSMEKIGSKVFMGTISNGIWVVDLSIPFALPNNKSAFFDGIQDRIRVLDTNKLNPDANPLAYKISGTSITLEAWIFPMDLPASNQNRVIIMRPCNNGFGIDPYQSFQLSILGNAPFSHEPRIGISITDGIHATFTGYEVFVEDTADVKVGEWTHVAGTYDGTNVKLYINGVLANQLPLNVSMGTGSSGLYIGGASFPNGYFKGLIDEVRLWNTVRSGSEIQTEMDETLIGNESGLAGYWPMEETYITSGGAIAVVDKTTNHNDLQVQYDAKLLDLPSGSDVIIPTTNVILSKNQAIPGEPFAAKFTTDGWPSPVINIMEKPAGLTQVGDSIFWTPSASQYWIEKVSTKISDKDNTILNDFYIESEAMEAAQNQLKLDVGNHGRLGAYSNYGKGMLYKTLNGLFSGGFSLVDRNNVKFAGGLYTWAPFCPNEGFSTTTSRFVGFNAFKTSFNDSWESNNRIGVNILETVHSSSTAGDDKYAIIEYELFNISGNIIDDLFAQLNADFDIGTTNQNLGGYDPVTETIYMYESGGANNPYYYGFTPLNCTVSGAAVFNVDANFIRTIQPLTTIEPNPTTPKNYRCQLSSGPYNINNGETKTIAYAIFAGDNLNDIKNSATRAKQVYVSNPPTTIPKITDNQYDGLKLRQNFPNPFQQSTQINYTVGKQGKVSVKIYNIEGKLIETLVDEIKSTGNYSMRFNAVNITSGIYYYQLQTDNYVITKKMVLMK